MSDVNINIKLVTQAAQAQLQQLNTKLKQTDDTLKGATDKTKKFGDRLSSVGTIARGVFVGNLIQSALYGIVQAATDTTFAFAKFETQLISIGKTTGLAGKELAELGEDFQELSQQIPVASEELLRIGTIAGQLGINGSKDILKFTETIARLGVSVEGASTEEFAKQISRIAALTRVPIQEVDRLTSSLIGLGNNVKANEAEISAIALRLSAATKQFNLSAQDVLGLSATFAELGISAELGGSASLRIFRSITNAAATGGATLDDYIRLTGLTAEQFKELAKSSPVDVLTLFAEGLSKLTSDTAEYNKTLARLELSELRAATAVSGLAGTYDRLRENVNRSRNDFSKNTATLEESNRAFASSESQIQLFRNSVIELQQELSEVLLPAVIRLVSGFRTITAATKNSIEALKEYFELGTTAKQTNEVFKGQDLNQALRLRSELVSELNQKIRDQQQIIVFRQRLVDAANGKEHEANEELKRQEIEKLNQLKRSRDFQERRVQIIRDAIAAQKELNSVENGSGGDGGTLQQEKTNARKLAIEAQFQEGLKLLNLQAEEEELIRNADFNERSFTALKSYYERVAELRFADQIQAAKVAGDETKLIELEAKKRLSVQENLQKSEEKINAQKVKNKQAFEDQINSLAAAGSKEAFRIQQAMAISNALINSNEAQAGAYAWGASIGGPPLGAIMSGIAKVATIAQVAAIANQSPPKFQDGGIVAGNNFSGDRVAARVNSGEMILNRAQQSQLFQLANGQGGAGQSAPQEIVLNNVIEIDGEVVFKSVSRQVADGKILGENQ